VAEASQKPLCAVCHEPVDVNVDEFVMTFLTRDAESPKLWIHAHVRCSPPVREEVSRE
jgi:hypothetical protein